MSKSILTIVSVVAVVLGSVFAYIFLNKGQNDTKLNLVSLNPIDNTESFLWIDTKQDETTFYLSDIQMDKSLTNSNPYFELVFIVEDVENNSYSSDGFSFSSNIGAFSDNTLRVSYNALGSNDELEVKLKVNTDIVDEGNYFLDVKLEAGTFNLSVLNNSEPLRLELEVNEKPNPLKVWLSILFVILLLAVSAWFLLLKKEYFPTFSKKGQLNISAPETSTIFLNKNARKLIIGNELKEKENFFTKLFYGKIQYEYLNSDHSIIIKPVHDFKTKKIWYIISTTNSTVINVSMKRYMNNGDKYVVNTNNEELIFNYLNVKHI